VRPEAMVRRRVRPCGKFARARIELLSSSDQPIASIGRLGALKGRYSKAWGTAGGGAPGDADSDSIVAL